MWNLKNFGDLSGAIAAIATALIVLFKTLVQPVYKKGKHLNEIWMNLESAVPKIEAISKELKTNGGHSLKDVVDNIGKSVTIMDMRQRVMMAVSDRVWFETTSDGLCTYVSPQWVELTGMSLEETLGNGWIRGVHPEDRTDVYQEWEDATRQGRDFHATFRLMNRKGEVKNVERVSYPVEDSAGHVISRVGTLTVVPDKV